MHHLTLTGPAAGQPFCDVNKAEARERGDTFSHVPYSGIAQFMARPDLCPACKRAWDEAGSDDAPEAGVGEP